MCRVVADVPLLYPHRNSRHTIIHGFPVVGRRNDGNQQYGRQYQDDRGNLEFRPLKPSPCLVQRPRRVLAIAAAPEVEARKNGEADPEHPQHLELQAAPFRQHLDGENEAAGIHDRCIYETLPQAAPAHEGQPKQGEEYPGNHDGHGLFLVVIRARREPAPVEGRVVRTQAPSPLRTGQMERTRPMQEEIGLADLVAPEIEVPTAPPVRLRPAEPGADERLPQRAHQRRSGSCSACSASLGRSRVTQA